MHLVHRLEEFIAVTERHLRQSRDKLREANAVGYYTEDYLAHLQKLCWKRREEIASLRKELFTACLKTGVSSEHLQK